MRPWIVFLQMLRDERSWEYRAERAEEAYFRGWLPSWQSQHVGVYQGQRFWGERYHAMSGPLAVLPRPTDDEVYQDRWL